MSDYEEDFEDTSFDNEAHVTNIPERNPAAKHLPLSDSDEQDSLREEEEEEEDKDLNPQPIVSTKAQYQTDPEEEEDQEDEEEKDQEDQEDEEEEEQDQEEEEERVYAAKPPSRSNVNQNQSQEEEEEEEDEEQEQEEDEEEEDEEEEERPQPIPTLQRSVGNQNQSSFITQQADIESPRGYSAKPISKQSSARNSLANSGRRVESPVSKEPIPVYEQPIRSQEAKFPFSKSFEPSFDIPPKDQKKEVIEPEVYNQQQPNYHISQRPEQKTKTDQSQGRPPANRVSPSVAPRPQNQAQPVKPVGSGSVPKVNTGATKKTTPAGVFRAPPKMSDKKSSKMKAAAQVAPAPIKRIQKAVDLENVIAEKDKIIEQLKEENRTLVTMARRQEKAISNLDHQQADIPKLIDSFQADIKVLKEKIKGYQQKLAVSDKTIKFHEEQTNKLKERCAKLEQILKSKNLDENIVEEDQKLRKQLIEKENVIAELEYKISVLQNSKDQEMKKLRLQVKSTSSEIDQLRKELTEANEIIKLHVRDKPAKVGSKPERNPNSRPKGRPNAEPKATTGDKADAPRGEPSPTRLAIGNIDHESQRKSESPPNSMATVKLPNSTRDNTPAQDYLEIEPHSAFHEVKTESNAHEKPFIAPPIPEESAPNTAPAKPNTTNTKSHTAETETSTNKQPATNVTNGAITSTKEKHKPPRPSRIDDSESDSESAPHSPINPHGKKLESYEDDGDVHDVITHTDIRRTPASQSKVQRDASENLTLSSSFSRMKITESHQTQETPTNTAATPSKPSQPSRPSSSTTRTQQEHQQSKPITESAVSFPGSPMHITNQNENQEENENINDNDDLPDYVNQQNKIVDSRRWNQSAGSGDQPFSSPSSRPASRAQDLPAEKERTHGSRPNSSRTGEKPSRAASSPLRMSSSLRQTPSADALASTRPKTPNEVAELPSVPPPLSSSQGNTTAQSQQGDAVTQESDSSVQHTVMKPAFFRAKKKYT